ncbi:MAG TPA: hypothetical protein VEI03_08800 [Stellaceae bacterium]|nr:hypothetical protein [Stellaceae bacterium]
MAKSKPKAVVMVPDGSGGVTAVKDRRFEQGDWPIQLDIPREHADTWLRYLQWECGKRGWNVNSLSQLEARENSGSINIATSVDQCALGVVWERKRDGPMKVRARSSGAPEFSLAEMREFFNHVDGRCRSGEVERIYRRGQLEYQGLAWRGEVWLDDLTRLGPPSRQDETAMIGPRVILVDAQIDCIGPADALWIFDRELRDLAAFLTVVMGTAVRLPNAGSRIWAWNSPGGADNCEVRFPGYLEPNMPSEMPPRGASRPMPLRWLTRPDFSLRGIDGSINEYILPVDVGELWAAYSGLAPNRRRDFLQAARKWQEALSQCEIDGSTLSYALMVVACEALKPPGREYWDHNIYHVVEALLGQPIAQQLKTHQVRPQDVRGTHLHRGEFRDDEIAVAAFISSFHDPTFGQARRDLAPIVQACIIEWLRRGGNLQMPAIAKRNTWRRWMKAHALTIVPFALALGAGIGWLLARLAR